MKLSFVPCDLPYEKVVKVKECFLELLDDHIIYKLDFVGEYMKDRDDPLLGSKEEDTYFEVRSLKTNINSIELDLTRGGNWCVTLYVTGSSRDLTIYFSKDNEVKAKAMHKSILDWWLTK